MRSLAVLLSILLGGSAAAHAQPSGSIVGTVQSTTVIGLPGATVEGQREAAAWVASARWVHEKRVLPPDATSLAAAAHLEGGQPRTA